MIETNDTLNFFVPINKMKSISKSKASNILVSGWASTGERDFQGETVEPLGIDATYLFNNGFINYEHDQDIVIGAPTKKSYVDPDKGLYVEAVLWRDVPEVQELMNLYDHIRDSGIDRSLGFSIEGNVEDRDIDDPSIIKKVMVTGVALTKNPANSGALLDTVVKSNNIRQIEKIKQENAYKTKMARVNAKKSFEAGYGISPDTQVDGASLRPESLANHLTYLAHSVELLNTKGGLDNFALATAKEIDKRNPEDKEIKALFLQVMTGISKPEALSQLEKLHEDEVSNAKTESGIDSSDSSSDDSDDEDD